MSEINYDNISKNVRNLVRLFNDNGFHTTDSGDGSHYQEGMEGAIPYPMIAIKLEAHAFNAVKDSYRLQKLLIDNGLSISKLMHDDEPTIQLNFSPVCGLALLIVSHITDKDIDFSEEIF